MRVNITIPDELDASIKELRNTGADINVSAVCQDCLRREVEFQKNTAAAPDAEAKAIVRLRRERETAQREWFDLGVEVGADAATDLEYNDLQKVVDYQSDIEAAGNVNSNLMRELDQVLTTYDATFEDTLRNGDYDGWSNLLDQVDANEGYYKGFCLAVSKFWDRVKDDVMASD